MKLRMTVYDLTFLTKIKEKKFIFENCLKFIKNQDFMLILNKLYLKLKL